MTRICSISAATRACLCAAVVCAGHLQAFPPAQRFKRSSFFFFLVGMLCLDKQTITLVSLVLTHLLAFVGPPHSAILPGPPLPITSTPSPPRCAEPCISNCTCSCSYPFEPLYFYVFFLGFGASSLLWVGFLTGTAWSRRRSSTARTAPTNASGKTAAAAQSGGTVKGNTDSLPPSSPTSPSPSVSETGAVDVAAVARAQLALIRSRR
jgi:hypothetical protein